jgi:tRNA(Ile)-lysidine synthase
VTQSVDQAIAAFEPALPLTVACSGGADSTALLVACVQKWPGQVRAVHVHHGLQAAADGFEQQVHVLCAQWAVPMSVYRVQAHPQQGESPEDAARKARYRAFTQCAQDAGVDAPMSLALAHHADDQVETLLLALSRGAGLPGLSAMASEALRAGICYHRPFLQVASADIRSWLQAQGIGFVDDPSNSDQRFTRNRIRAQLMPVLQDCFAHFRDTFARSAAHAAQAQALLEEVAAQDLAFTGLPPRIKALQTLSPARQANVLRHWLKQQHGVAPSSAQMQALLHQIAACTTRGHSIDLKLAHGRCQRLGDGLHWYNP